MTAFKLRPKDNTITKSVRMPVQMVEKMDAIAEENNLSFTDVVLQCIEYALDSMGDAVRGTDNALHENKR